MTGGVKLNLGGKERQLRYDLNAIAELGDRLEIRIRLAHFEKDLMNVMLPPSAIRTLIWAGLIADEPDLTEKEVGSWVTQDNFMEVLTGFFGLFGEMSSETREQVAGMVGMTVEDLEGARDGSPPATPMTEVGVAESAEVPTHGAT